VRRVFGPRFAVEAAFVVTVPVVALLVGLGATDTIAASALGYLLVLVVEVTLWREGAPLLEAIRTRRAARAMQKTAAAAWPAPVPRETEPVPAAEPAPAPEPERASEPVAVRQPEHVRVIPAAPPPEPEPEPEPEPAAAERAPLVAVPAPEPEPEPEPERVPEPVAAVATVIPIGVGAGPQRWNLWDLERMTRERAGGDALRDEERTFLLMYLREFAGPDGLLPVDFDGLVRDSFGDLVGV